MEYILEKAIWTDADFDQMGWHDAQIYKLVINKGRLLLDIDYIFKWNQPEVEGLSFTFWVAPCTLVFKDISQLDFEMDVFQKDVFEIEDIVRESNADVDRWTIITQQGAMAFNSNGYTQYVRQTPVFEYGQTLDYVTRNGYSVEETILNENPYLSHGTYKEKRAREAELYDYARKRQLKILEMNTLQKKRELGEIDTKAYLQQKKDLNNTIEGWGYYLKNTRFDPR